MNIKVIGIDLAKNVFQVFLSTEQFCVNWFYSPAHGFLSQSRGRP
jgi:hypothetical protein